MLQKGSNRGAIFFICVSEPIPVASILP
jgi:hypothetical protein